MATRTPGPAPGIVESALTLVALVLAAVVLVVLGRGPLAGPDAWTASGVGAWLGRTDSTLTALATLRLAALATTAHCALVISLELVGRATRRPDLVSVARRLTLPPLRRSVTAVAGLTLSTTSLVVAHGALPAPAEHGAGPTVTLERLPDESPDDAATMSAPQDLDEAWADATRASDSTEAPSPAPPAAPDPEPEPGATPAPAATPAHQASAAATPTEWTVAPGDHLWGIAEATLTERWGRAPTEAETAPHWRALIARNRTRLVDPNAPDLLLPGQVLEVPPLG